MNNTTNSKTNIGKYKEERRKGNAVLYRCVIRYRKLNENM